MNILRSGEQEKTEEKYKMKNKVHEKGYRNTPLTNEQKTAPALDGIKSLNVYVVNK